jgi:hypothetical protein
MAEPMRPPACEATRDLAPELALGLVTGRERAAAFAHLDGCPACRAHVEGLTSVHDALSALPPAQDPPAGFESRVLARLPRPHPRPRRRRTYALVAVMAAALLGAGWAGGVVATAPPAAVATAAPVLRVADVVADGRRIGEAFVHPGSPAWLYMYLDLDRPPAAVPVTCTLVHADGTRSVAGTLTLTGGDAYWGGPLDTDLLASVQVTDRRGAVVAAASIGAG